MIGDQMTTVNNIGYNDQLISKEKARNSFFARYEYSKIVECEICICSYQPF